ncbi:MAG: hypothetical protein K5895_05310 [Lachnospiraceae bacterium]|nr:hypothetical protein [Lachnospiraceae bacterium]
MIKFNKVFENLLVTNNSDSISVRTEGLDNATVALNYRYFSLMTKKEKDEIASLENKIANKNGNYRKDQIESFKLDLGVKKTNLEKFETHADETYEGYSNYMALFSNEDAQTVKLVLGIMSAQYTPKLWDYVANEFTGAFENTIEKVFTCMECIHKPDTKNLTDLGLVKTSSVSKSVKEVTGILQDTLFNTFSIKAEGESCPWNKLNLRFNATRLHYIHEVYIRDLKDTSHVKDGELTNGKVELVSSIKKTTKKDGTVEYNCTKFCKSLLMLVKDMIVEKVANK